MVKFLEEQGLASGDADKPGVLLQCDPESAVVAIQRAVLQRVKGAKPREAPKDSHESQGLVERFIQTMQGMARTWKHATEKLHGIHITADHKLASWLMRNASFCHDRLHERRETSKTGYEQRTGRKFTQKMVPFAEPVWFKRPGDVRTKFEPMWSCGIWLGRHDTSNEHLIGTKFGTLCARCVRRMPADLQREKKLSLIHISEPTRPY